MKMTFRWFGEADPVKLEHIRQIPGVVGVVSSLHDMPVGEAWPVVREEGEWWATLESNQAWVSPAELQSAAAPCSSSPDAGRR